jgi:ubiquinone/menaquinone biosynthesis C-methylase UbiE
MQSHPYPYKSSFFDGVLAIRAIHHTTLAEIKNIVREVERVTRLGGFLYLNAPTFSKALRLKAKGVKSEEVEPGTFLPFEGEEQGILHHHFKEEELRELLTAWSISDLHVSAEHYCVTATKTS